MSLKKITIMCIMCFLLFIFLDKDSNYTDNKNTKENIVDALLIEEKNISEKDAIENVKIYLHQHGESLPNIIEVDQIDGNYYLVHSYDIIKYKQQSHTTTTGWFYVNIYTGEVIDMMNS